MDIYQNDEKTLISDISKLLSGIYSNGNQNKKLMKFAHDDVNGSQIQQCDDIDIIFENCNITEIDRKIKIKLKSHDDIHNIMLRIERLKHNLSIQHNMIQDKIYKEEILYLNSKLEDIKNNKQYNEYINFTKHFIIDYLKCLDGLHMSITISGGKQTNEIKEEKDNYRKRMIILSNYLDIASKYIKINIHRNINRTGDICLECGEKFIDEGDFYYCENCGIEISKVKDVTSDKEQKPYNPEDNFIKGLNKLQGKDTYIPLGIYEVLDNFCISTSYLTGEEIKNLPLLSDGTKQGTSLDLLQFILRSTKNKLQYENMSLIAHEYWGWILYDLTMYESLIIQDYRKLESMYNIINTDGVSSINVQYKLFRIVSRYYPECHKSHFKLPKDIVRLEQLTWRAFKKLNWEFIPITI